MKDLTSKTKEELEKDLRDKEESLRAFRFGIAGSKVRDVKDGRNLRKTIARIKTALSLIK